MAGIKDYSTTAASNTSVGGVSIAEGMLPSNINNAFRAITADIREWYNDSQWVEYGDGDGSFTATYASATSFTISGVDVTSFYHANRRIKITATTPGTIYGTISSSSFSTDTTVNVTWDSGSLSNETIDNVLVGVLSNTNDSIPEDVISTAKIEDSAITSAKLADLNVTDAKLASSAVTENKIAANAVTNAKLADDAVDSAEIADGAIDTVHIADAQITTAKIAGDAVTNAKIADDSIDSEHYVDGSIDTAHIGDLQVTAAKLAVDSVTAPKIADNAVENAALADNSVDSDQIVGSAIDTVHIADAQVTTAKLADDAVTAAKISDSTLITASEVSGYSSDDTSLFTTAGSDARYFRQDSSESIQSGDTWSASDSYIATTSAIDNRIVDLLDDVGGFVPISNETSFPTSNPDANDDAGTIVSIQSITTTRTPSSGTVTIANGAGSNTVTINNCGTTVLTAGFGVLVETTSTLHTYNFHRLTPKATEVTTVASISSDISTVAGDEADIGVVSGLSTDIQALADIEDGTDATNAISNVGNNISNVTTVSANIAGVNSFAERYRVAATDPTTSLDEGDLVYNTTDDVLRYYDGSAWQNIQANTDTNVKVSSNDTTAGFLNGKLVAGTNITLTENSDGGNETLTISTNAVDEATALAIALG